MSESEHTTEVEYRGIPRAPGYRAANDGRIQSCIILGGRSPRLGTEWHNLKLTVTKRGYQVVGIKREGERIHVEAVGPLILETFVGPKPEGMECCHFPDRSPTNNRLDNLRWATHQENEDDKKVHGTRPKGSVSKNAKLTEDDIRAMISLYATGGVSKISIARKYGLHHSTVIDILNRKTWQHVE